MDAKYNPTDIEAKWYQYWQDNKLFHSTPDGREPYTVVIPSDALITLTFFILSPAGDTIFTI